MEINPIKSKILSNINSHIIVSSQAFREDDPVKLEKYLSGIRSAGIVITSIILPLIVKDNLVIAYIPLIFAAIYTSIILGIVVPFRPNWLRGGYLACLLDGTSLSAALAVTGGDESAFFVIYYPLAALYALRFGRKQIWFTSVVATSTFGLAIIVAGRGPLAEWGLFVFRMYWVLTTGLIAGVLSERAEGAESALRTELQRTQALLRAAHAPAASLTIDGVLQAVVHESRLLTESAFSAIYLFRTPDYQQVFLDSGGSDLSAQALREILVDDPQMRRVILTSGQVFTPADLARNGVLRANELAALTSIGAALIPAERGSLGFVTVATRGPNGLRSHQMEALSAFLQRAALAIQNARLYEQLQAQLEELRTMQGHVVRSERLAVLGELAAKVAHEINNPLTSIHLYNSMLMEEPAEPDEQRRIAVSVQEQVERAKQVVRDVLDYSRSSPPSLDVTSLNATVEHGLRMVRHAAAAAHVQVVEDYAGNLPPVRVDVNQLVQVYTNLTTNAIQATGPNGRLTVTTGLLDGEVYVKFEDNGSGVAPEHLERIFDAFYTTKPVGEGTGLGLSVCRNLIARHHGRITVESEVGKGSIFTVWLPPAQVKEGIIARPGIG